MLRTIFGLTLGGVAGLAAYRFSFPLPWLIGPLLACAAVSLAGLDLNQPTALRKIGQMIAAIAIGLTFTPSVVEQLVGYLPLMVMAAALSMTGALVIARATMRIGAVTFETAFFSSLPGGVAEMSVLAERYKGEASLVALAQSLRIIIVVLSVPPLIVLFVGHADFSASLASGTAVMPLALIAMGGAALLLSLLLDRFGIMNAWFLGGLAVGASITLIGIPASGIPIELVNLAQVLIGCALGTRINRSVLLKLRHFLPASIVGTAALILFNVCTAAALSAWTGFDPSAMILATAPGGVAEMSITAQALHLAVPAVTAFHLVRVLMIILLSAPFYRLSARLRARSLSRQPAE